MEAAAGFFNAFFRPSEHVLAAHVLATNGVTASIDMVAWSLCEPGDAILYPIPSFYMLDLSLTLRNGVVAIPVAVEHTVGVDPFAATEQAARDVQYCFSRAIRSLSDSGVRCRAVFLCNPTNPQGRCYPPATLQSLARLCTQNGMHLIADEIYALSNFSGGKEPFSSVLGIPKASTSNFQNIHCLYGMSKDFSFGGLRMGFVVTRNDRLVRALKKLSYVNLAYPRLWHPLDSCFYL